MSLEKPSQNQEEIKLVHLKELLAKGEPNLTLAEKEKLIDLIFALGPELLAQIESKTA